MKRKVSKQLSSLASISVPALNSCPDIVRWHTVIWMHKVKQTLSFPSCSESVIYHSNRSPKLGSRFVISVILLYFFEIVFIHGSVFDSKIEHSKVRHRWILHSFFSCMSTCTFLLLLAFPTYLSCFSLSIWLPHFCLFPCPYVYVIFLSFTNLLSTDWYVIFY